MQPLTAMPTSFSSGSTLTYTRTVTDYPAGTGWTLSVHVAGKSKISKAASASGTDYLVTLTAAETAALEPGTYSWLERVVNGTEARDVASGTVTVKPNLATALAGDLQSWDEKALAVVEAALLNTLGNDLVSYQLPGRGAVKVDRTEAVKLRDALARRVQRRRNGGKLGQTIFTRFGRP